MKISIAFLTCFIFFTVNTTAQTGYLDVKSQPANAEIYINNIFKGKTPSQIELSPGSYKLRLEHEGYEPFVKNIKIASDLVLNENANLKGYVKLSVFTNPSGSIIYIDGKKLADRTPIDNYLISTGNHKVKVISYRIPGYKSKGISETKNVNIQEDHSININFYKKLGSLHFSSNPPTSSFYLNNNLINVSSENLKFLLPGTYNVRAKAYLSKPYNEELQIEADYNIRANRKTSAKIDFYKTFKLGRLNLQTNLNTNFILTRLDEINGLSRTIKADSNRPYINKNILVAKYKLSWTDVKENELTFQIFDNKTTYLFVPVKKSLAPIKKLSDLDSYISQQEYINKNYNPLPEYKSKSYLFYGKRNDYTPNKFKTVYGITTSFAMVGGIIAFAASGEKNAVVTGKIALAGIGLWGVNFILRFEKRKKQVKIMENIVKNQDQKNKVLSEYDKILKHMKQKLEVENKLIIEENKTIEDYNKNLPDVEIKYLK